MNAEERAYALLNWQALAPLADFDESFPYAELQRQRSDKALDQWEKDHPVNSSPELTAFRELEKMGHYTQNDYFSPSKAANGFYTDQFRQATERDHEGDRQRRGQRIKGTSKPRRIRREPHERV